MKYLAFFETLVNTFNARIPELKSKSPIPQLSVNFCDAVEPLHHRIHFGSSYTPLEKYYKLNNIPRILRAFFKQHNVDFNIRNDSEYNDYAMLEENSLHQHLDTPQKENELSELAIQWINRKFDEAVAAEKRINSLINEFPSNSVHNLRYQYIRLGLNIGFDSTDYIPTLAFRTKTYGQLLNKLDQLYPSYYSPVYHFRWSAWSWRWSDIRHTGSWLCSFRRATEWLLLLLTNQSSLSMNGLMHTPTMKVT